MIKKVKETNGFKEYYRSQHVISRLLNMPVMNNCRWLKSPLLHKALIKHWMSGENH